MELSLEMMKDRSYQVEMSDEGRMASDIEECLEVVVQALKKCDLPPEAGLIKRLSFGSHLCCVSEFVVRSEAFGG
jgi:hypothetical protein